MDPQLKLLRETVRQNQIEANERTTKIYNAKTTTKVPKFKIMDRVWLFDPSTRGEKLAHKVMKKFRGPFLIIDANPEFHIYKLQECSTQKIWKSWVHADRLRLYCSDRDLFYDKNNRRAVRANLQATRNGE